MPKLATSSSAHDLPMRLKQNNNANPQMIDSLNYKSNEHYFNNNNNIGNKTNSTIMDNHRNSFYPKMNFTSSIMTTAASTLPNKVMPGGNVPIVLDTDANKSSKHVNNLTGQNDQCSMQNMVTQNYNLTNSFSTGAMTNLHLSNNCNFNSIQSSGQHRPQFQYQPPPPQQQQQRQLQQQQPPVPISASSTLAYSSNSNTTQIQTLNTQSSQQMQSQQQQQQQPPPQQNLGTKVTTDTNDRKHIFLSLLFASVVYSTNRVRLNC